MVGFFVVEGLVNVMFDVVCVEVGEEQEVVWLVQQVNDQWVGVLLVSSGVLLVIWLEDVIFVVVVQCGLVCVSVGMVLCCLFQGLFELCECIVMLLCGQGIVVDVGCVLMIYGGIQVIDLICCVLLCFGDVVVVEMLGYFLLFDCLCQVGVIIVLVLWWLDGIDFEVFDVVCICYWLCLLFIQSVLYNFIGWGSMVVNLYCVLMLVQCYDLLIVEDDV